MLDHAAQRLQVVLGLSPHAAARVLEEVLDCFDQDVDQHIQRRHAELQRAGLGNEAIFAQVKSEIEALRFKAPPLSVRQIRRRIYG